MSYHPIGQFDLFAGGSPARKVVGGSNVSTSQTDPAQQVLWWGDIHQSLRRLVLLLNDVAARNMWLSSSEKRRVREEAQRLNSLRTAVPPGPLSASGRSALARAKQEGGVPSVMSLIRKSRATGVISEAERVRQVWDRLAASLPASTNFLKLSFLTSGGGRDEQARRQEEEQRRREEEQRERARQERAQAEAARAAARAAAAQAAAQAAARAEAESQARAAQARAAEAEERLRLQQVQAGLRLQQAQAEDAKKKRLWIGVAVVGVAGAGLFFGLRKRK